MICVLCAAGTVGSGIRGRSRENGLLWIQEGVYVDKWVTNVRDLCEARGPNKAVSSCSGGSGHDGSPDSGAPRGAGLLAYCVASQGPTQPAGVAPETGARTDDETLGGVGSQGVAQGPMADTDTAGTAECEVQAGASDAEGCGMGASDDFGFFEETAVLDLGVRNDENSTKYWILAFMSTCGSRPRRFNAHPPGVQVHRT